MKRKPLGDEDDQSGKKRRSHLPYVEIFKDETLLQLIEKSKRDESANRLLECNRHKIIFGNMIKEKLISNGESIGSIEDVVCTIDHFFVLTSKGFVYSYNRDENKLEGIINRDNEEVTSISLNKYNSSLILIYFPKEEEQRILCKSISISNIVQCKYELCEELLTKENLSNPSFVEIDDFHQVILSFSASKNSYKIWSLKDYSLRFEMTGKFIQDVKLSPMGIFVRFLENRGVLPLKIVDYLTGNEICSIKLKTKDRGKITFLEYFGNHLFYMQEHRRMTIIDPIKNKVVAVQQHFVHPNTFVYLHKWSKILGVKDSRDMAIWNLKGALEIELEDHKVVSENSCCFTVTKDEKVILSLCRDSSCKLSIHASDIKTGALLTSVECRDLDQITSISFCEDRNQLVVGNKDGKIALYSLKN